MRGVKLLLLLATMSAVGGCAISRTIADVTPPTQPDLTQLEQHLDYVDPDDGQPDYIVE
jgi:hypothetical protein